MKYARGACEASCSVYELYGRPSRRRAGDIHAFSAFCVRWCSLSLSQVLDGMRSGTTDGTDLSMAIWALAVLRRPPSAEWMTSWWQATAAPRVADTFDGTCVAQSLTAAALLRTLMGQPDGRAWLYNKSRGDVEGEEEVAAAAVAALLARMSGCLRSTSTSNLSTTIAALADLQYRYGKCMVTTHLFSLPRQPASPPRVLARTGRLTCG